MITDFDAVRFLTNLFQGAQQEAAVLRYWLARAVGTPIVWAVASGVVVALKRLATTRHNGHGSAQVDE